MKEVTEKVKGEFKKNGMERWEDVKAYQSDDGEIRVIAHNRMHSDYEPGEYAVWKYLPDDNLSALNYPVYSLTKDKADQMIRDGWTVL